MGGMRRRKFLSQVAQSSVGLSLLSAASCASQSRCRANAKCNTILLCRRGFGELAGLSSVLQMLLFKSQLSVAPIAQMDRAAVS